MQRFLRFTGPPDNPMLRHFWQRLVIGVVGLTACQAFRKVVEEEEVVVEEEVVQSC